jgi:hypothetical protein
MTARRSRRRSVAFATLAAALCGTLALTGCSHSKSSKSRSHSSSSSSSSVYKDKKKNKKKHRLIGAGAGVGAGAAAHQARPTECPMGVARFKVTSGWKPSVLVITYHNPLGRPCILHGAPHVTLNDSRTPLGYLEGDPKDSFLGRRINVQPRSDAYALIPTTTPATKGTKPLKNLSVSFTDRSGNNRASTATLSFSQYQTLYATQQAKVGN